MGECIIKDDELKLVEKYINKIIAETIELSISYLQQLDIVCTTGINGSAVVEAIKELAAPLYAFAGDPHLGGGLEQDRKLYTVAGDPSNSLQKQCSNPTALFGKAPDFTKGGITSSFSVESATTKYITKLNEKDK